MKTLFTAEAISKGGRSGTIQTPDGLLDVTLGNPLEKGIEKRGPNPELLFAGAYSACYHGALGNAAKKLGTPVKDSTVRALVSLIEDDQGGYRLAVELHAQLPGIDRIQAQRIMDEAHKTCPIPKPCAATLPSSWWWTDRQSQCGAREHFCRHVGGESKQTTKTN
jgi:osmotically inducible protein OsmC